jgi:hypothetical protein
MELPKHIPQPRNISEITSGLNRQSKAIKNQGKGPERFGNINTFKHRLKVDQKQTDDKKKVLKPHVVDAIVLSDNPFVASDEPFREDCSPLLFVYEIQLTHPSFGKFPDKKVYFVSNETYTNEPDETMEMLISFLGRHKNVVTKINPKVYCAINVLDMTPRFYDKKLEKPDASGKPVYELTAVNKQRKWMLLDFTNQFSQADAQIKGSLEEIWEVKETIKHLKITLERHAGSKDMYGSLTPKTLTKPTFLTAEEVEALRVPDNEEPVKGHDGNTLPSDWRTTAIRFEDMFKPITPEQSEEFQDYVQELAGS